MNLNRAVVSKLSIHAACHHGLDDSNPQQADLFTTPPRMLKKFSFLLPVQIFQSQAYGITHLCNDSDGLWVQFYLPKQRRREVRVTSPKLRWQLMPALIRNCLVGGQWRHHFRKQCKCPNFLWVVAFFHEPFQSINNHILCWTVS